MKTEKQIRHEELIKFLKKFPQYQDGKGNSIIHEVKNSRGSRDFSKIDITDINYGVVCFTDFLNITGGSIGSIDFYRLLQGYMLDINKREAINKIIG